MSVPMEAEGQKAGQLPGLCDDTPSLMQIWKVRASVETALGISELRLTRYPFA
jgi:hypothetical protein